MTTAEYLAHQAAQARADGLDDAADILAQAAEFAARVFGQRPMPESRDGATLRPLDHEPGVVGIDRAAGLQE